MNLSVSSRSRSTFRSGEGRHASFTTAEVRDFHVGSDTLEIHGVNPATDFAAVHMSSNPAMTLVDIGQDHIKLLGVDHVSASDFLFHV